MAEINHSFTTPVTTPVTTTSTTYTDIAGATIASTEFVTGRKYLIFILAKLEINSGANILSAKTLHGSTDFAESEMVNEGGGAAQYFNYKWFTVWTAVSGEGIKMQFKASAGTVTADQITLFAMEISEDLTENTDWFFDHNATSTSMTTSNSTTNNATVTFTPGTAGDDWLVMFTARTSGNSISANTENKLTRSGEAAETEIMESQEGEDNADRMLHAAWKVYNLGAASNTFEEQVRRETGGGTRISSSVFAINLNKFEKHSSSYTAGSLAINNSSKWFHNTVTNSMTPDTAGNIWIVGGHRSQSTQKTGFRMQVDNADDPATQTSDDLSEPIGFDAGDRHLSVTQTVANLSAASHTVDVDSHDQGADTFVTQRGIFQVSMELAAAAPAGGGELLSLSHIQNFNKQMIGGMRS